MQARCAKRGWRVLVEVHTIYFQNPPPARVSRKNSPGGRALAARGPLGWGAGEAKVTGNETTFRQLSLRCQGDLFGEGSVFISDILLKHWCKFSVFN